MSQAVWNRSDKANSLGAKLGKTFESRFHETSKGISLNRNRSSAQANLDYSLRPWMRNKWAWSDDNVSELVSTATRCCVVILSVFAKVTLQIESNLEPQLSMQVSTE